MTEREKPLFGGLDRNEREQAVSRRDVLRSGAAGFAITVGLAGAPGVASAEQGAVYDFFESEEDETKSDRLGKAISSLRAGVGRVFADDEKRSASESATETTSVFNANADVLVTYANDHFDDDRKKTGVDVIRLEFVEQETTVKRWITATVDESNSSFVDASMSDSEPDADADHYGRLKKLARADAPDELERFVDEYAKPGEPVDDAYVGRLAGRYGPDVETSLMD
jgi:hypothetical protein